LTTSSNGKGTLTVITNNTALGVNGTETFSVAIVNSKHAVISEFDSSATAVGSLDFQFLAAIVDASPPDTADSPIGTIDSVILTSVYLYAVDGSHAGPQIGPDTIGP